MSILSADGFAQKPACAQSLSNADLHQCNFALQQVAGLKQVSLALQEQYGFAAKMRNQAIEQLKALETWVERQATGLDMAANPESLRQSFDKLLKVRCTCNLASLICIVACNLYMMSFTGAVLACCLLGTLRAKILCPSGGARQVAYPAF